MRTPHFLQPLLQASADSCSIVVERTGRVLASHVERAFDSTSRRRGLLRREGLAPGRALVIAPCNGVHTWFMRFPIDLLFVARDGTVMKVRANVRPWRIAAALRAFAVIELCAGTAHDAAVRTGDRLALHGAADHRRPPAAAADTMS